uniref:Uncharacterized protein n=1 Tax=Neospora caninum (strain Liverpool) TaxID=572307 RepID=A0A0F7U776_NEOCL|nr:TPA: hypothetical protein BN1204_003660 [Neospora caninum Liverpool]
MAPCSCAVSAGCLEAAPPDWLAKDGLLSRLDSLDAPVRKGSLSRQFVPHKSTGQARDVNVSDGDTLNLPVSGSAHEAARCAASQNCSEEKNSSAVENGASLSSETPSCASSLSSSRFQDALALLQRLAPPPVDACSSFPLLAAPDCLPSSTFLRECPSVSLLSSLSTALSSKAVNPPAGDLAPSASFQPSASSAAAPASASPSSPSFSVAASSVPSDSLPLFRSRYPSQPRLLVPEARVHASALGTDEHEPETPCPPQVPSSSPFSSSSSFPSSSSSSFSSFSSSFSSFASSSAFLPSSACQRVGSEQEERQPSPRRRPSFPADCAVEETKGIFFDAYDGERKRLRSTGKYGAVDESVGLRSIGLFLLSLLPDCAFPGISSEDDIPTSFDGRSERSPAPSASTQERRLPRHADEGKQRGGANGETCPAFQAFNSLVAGKTPSASATGVLPDLNKRAVQSILDAVAVYVQSRELASHEAPLSPSRSSSSSSDCNGSAMRERPPRGAMWRSDREEQLQPRQDSAVPRLASPLSSELFFFSVLRQVHVATTPSFSRSVSSSSLPLDFPQRQLHLCTLKALRSMQGLPGWADTSVSLLSHWIVDDRYPFSGCAEKERDALLDEERLGLAWQLLCGEPGTLRLLLAKLRETAASEALSLQGEADAFACARNEIKGTEKQEPEKHGEGHKGKGDLEEADVFLSAPHAPTLFAAKKHFFLSLLDLLFAPLSTLTCRSRTAALVAWMVCERSRSEEEGARGEEKSEEAETRAVRETGETPGLVALLLTRVSEASPSLRSLLQSCASENLRRGDAHGDTVSVGKRLPNPVCKEHESRTASCVPKRREETRSDAGLTEEREGCVVLGVLELLDALVELLACCCFYSAEVSRSAGQADDRPPRDGEVEKEKVMNNDAGDEDKTGVGQASLKKGTLPAAEDVCRVLYALQAPKVLIACARADPAPFCRLSSFPILLENVPSPLAPNCLALGSLTKLVSVLTQLESSSFSSSSLSSSSVSSSSVSSSSVSSSSVSSLSVSSSSFSSCASRSGTGPPASPHLSLGSQKLSVGASEGGGAGVSSSEAVAVFSASVFHCVCRALSWSASVLDCAWETTDRSGTASGGRDPAGEKVDFANGCSEGARVAEGNMREGSETAKEDTEKAKNTREAAQDEQEGGFPILGASEANGPPGDAGEAVREEHAFPSNAKLETCEGRGMREKEEYVSNSAVFLGAFSPLLFSRCPAEYAASIALLTDRLASPPFSSRSSPTPASRSVPSPFASSPSSCLLSPGSEAFEPSSSLQEADAALHGDGETGDWKRPLPRRGLAKKLVWSLTRALRPSRLEGSKEPQRRAVLAVCIGAFRFLANEVDELGRLVAHAGKEGRREAHRRGRRRAPRDTSAFGSRNAETCAQSERRGADEQGEDRKTREERDPRELPSGKETAFSQLIIQGERGVVEDLFSTVLALWRDLVGSGFLGPPTRVASRERHTEKAGTRLSDRDLNCVSNSNEDFRRSAPPRGTTGQASPTIDEEDALSSGVSPLSCMPSASLLFSPLHLLDALHGALEKSTLCVLREEKKPRGEASEAAEKKMVLCLLDALWRLTVMTCTTVCSVTSFPSRAPAASLESEKRRTFRAPRSFLSAFSNCLQERLLPLLLSSARLPLSFPLTAPHPLLSVLSLLSVPSLLDASLSRPRPTNGRRPPRTTEGECDGESKTGKTETGLCGRPLDPQGVDSKGEKNEKNNAVSLPPQSDSAKAKQGPILTSTHALSSSPCSSFSSSSSPYSSFSSSSSPCSSFSSSSSPCSSFSSSSSPCSSFSSSSSVSCSASSPVWGVFVAFHCLLIRCCRALLSDVPVVLGSPLSLEEGACLSVSEKAFPGRVALASRTGASVSVASKKRGETRRENPHASQRQAPSPHDDGLQRRAQNATFPPPKDAVAFPDASRSSRSEHAASDRPQSRRELESAGTEGDASFVTGARFSGGCRGGRGTGGALSSPSDTSPDRHNAEERTISCAYEILLATLRTLTKMTDSFQTNRRSTVSCASSCPASSSPCSSSDSSSPASHFSSGRLSAVCPRSASAPRADPETRTARVRLRRVGTGRLEPRRGLALAAWRLLFDTATVYSDLRLPLLLLAEKMVRLSPAEHSAEARGAPGERFRGVASLETEAARSGREGRKRRMQPARDTQRKGSEQKARNTDQGETEAADGPFAWGQIVREVLLEFFHLSASTEARSENHQRRTRQACLRLLTLRSSPPLHVSRVGGEGEHPVAKRRGSREECGGSRLGSEKTRRPEENDSGEQGRGKEGRQEREKSEATKVVAEVAGGRGEREGGDESEGEEEKKRKGERAETERDGFLSWLQQEGEEEEAVLLSLAHLAARLGSLHRADHGFGAERSGDLRGRPEKTFFDWPVDCHCRPCAEANHVDCVDE